MSSRSGKARALVLTLLMIGSVFGGTIAFAGGAAAVSGLSVNSGNPAQPSATVTVAGDTSTSDATVNLNVTDSAGHSEVLDGFTTASTSPFSTQLDLSSLGFTPQGELTVKANEGASYSEGTNQDSTTITIDGTAPTVHGVYATADNTVVVEIDDDTTLSSNDLGTNDFTVNVGGASQDLQSANLDGNEVTITLATGATAIDGGQKVTVSYTPSTESQSTSITDAAGNELASFDQKPANGIRVTSLTTQPDGEGATSTHTLDAEIMHNSSAIGSSFTDVGLEYNGATDLSNVGQGDIVDAYVDKGDTQEPIDIGEVSLNNGVLTIAGSSDNLAAGDVVHIEYADVQNGNGDETVDVSVNQQSADSSDTEVVSYNENVQPDLDVTKVNDSTSIDDDAVTYGDQLTKKVSIKNNGNIEDSATLELRVAPDSGESTLTDGYSVQSTTDVSVNGGTSENYTVTLDTTNLSAAADTYDYGFFLTNFASENDADGPNSLSTTDDGGSALTVEYNVSLSPNATTVGSTETVNGMVTGLEDSETVSYTLYNTSENTATNKVASGTTSSGQFSTTQTFDEIGDYDFVITSENGPDTTATFSVNYAADVNITPSDATRGDTVTVSGNVTDANGGVSGADVQLVPPTESGSVGSATTAQNGQFSFTATVKDAGTYTVTDGSGTTTYDEYTVPADDANVSVAVTDGSSLAAFESTYNVTATQTNGDALPFGDSGATNYVNVTGPFASVNNTDTDAISGGTLVAYALDDGTTKTDADATLTNLASDDDSHDIAYIHVTPTTTDDTTANNFKLNATPSTDATAVSAELDNTESDAYAGIEADEGANLDSPAEPDYVGSASTSVGSAEGLNVDVDPTEFSVDDSYDGQSIDVTVSGPNNEAPGADGSALKNATVSVSGPGFEAEQYIEGGDQPSSFTVYADEAGSDTVNVTAYSTEDEENITQSVDLTVTGDNYANLTPTSAEVGDNTSVGVQVTQDGTPQNNRVVRFQSANGNNVFNVSETDTAFKTLTINARQGQAKFGTTGESRTINTNNGEYVVQNVSFENTGDVNLRVTNPDDDPENNPDVTVNATSAFSVTGVDVYDVTSNAPNGQLLASQEQTVQFNVTEDGERVNGSALEDLAVGPDGDQTFFATQNEESVLDSVTTVNTTGDSAVDTIEATLTVPSAENAVNVSVSASGQRGETSYDVVTPTITTNMTGDALTEATANGPMNVTVTDPRTGDVIPSATLQVTPYNTSIDLSGDISTDGISSPSSESVTTDENGSAVLTVTPDVLGDDPASVEFATKASASASAFVAPTNVSVDEITTGAPDTVAPDTQTSTTFVVRDANDNGLESRTISLNGAGVTKDGKNTDSDGVVDFTFTPSTGTVNININNEYSSGDDTVTVDTIDARQQVALSLSAHDLPAYAGDSVSFELNRGDVSDVSVKGTLTVYNASDDVVKTTSITGTKSVQFNESGDYTVVASKDPTDSKSFANASANVTIQGYANASITADPATNNTTSTHSVTLPVTADAAGDSLNGIEIDYSAGDSMTDVSEVGIDNIQSVTVSGDSVMVQEASVSNNGHTLQLSFTGDTQLQQGDVVEIVYDDVQNPASAGDYEVTSALNYQSDPVNTQSMTLTITNASETSSVDQAIAGDDGQISDSEILTAIDYWRAGEEVPNTGGQKISDTQALSLINQWRSGNEV